MIINVSTDRESYSQRNNAIKPLDSCNVTSMVMALDYLGYRFPAGEYDQPEDNLRKFIEDNGKSPENHADLSEFTNRWMNKQVTKFTTGKRISEIFSELLDGRPVVISGTFPGYPHPHLNKAGNPEALGHIICLVGAEWKGNDWIGPPDYVFWDDPYGNTMNDWMGSGNDVKIEYQRFVDWIKPVGNATVKWAHSFFR
jgi:hypothetical protein